MILKHLAAKTLLLFVLHSTVVSSVPRWQSIPLFVAGQVDAASTYRVDALHPDQFHENNPLLQPFQRNATIFPAMLVGDSIVLDLSNHYGQHHKILRALVVYGFAGLHVWCAVHNLNLEPSHPQQVILGLPR